MPNRMLPIGKLFNLEKGVLQSTKCTPGEFDFITAAEDWKTHSDYSHECEALVFAAAASGSLGRTHYVDGKFTSSDLCFILTPRDQEKYLLNLSFYHFVFNSLRPTIVATTKSGTSKESINQKNLKKYEIPYFDIEQQEFWIGKLQNTLGIRDLLDCELLHQQVLLKRLRQQILQEAIEGKLTTNWRASKSDVDSASELLNYIATEKSELIAAKKVKKGKKQPPSESFTETVECPESWVLADLDDISIYVTDGTHQTPTYTSKGRTFLSAQNVKPFKFMPEDHRFVSEEAYQEYIKNRFVEKGDLVLGRVGAGIGETAVVDVDIECAIYVSLGLVKTFKSHTNPDYLAIVFNSPYGVRYAKGNISSGGGSAGNFNLGRIRSFPVPFPPLLEQKAIVEKVHELLTICDQLEAQINQNQTYADALMQAVLREAFTQPSDEEVVIDAQQTNDIVPIKMEGSDYYKRTLLAAEIVDQLHQEPTLGHLKLQKLIFLCQKTQAMQLPTNFLQQAAGPYDPKMARSLDKQLRDKRWFEYRKNELHKYQPLDDAGSHKGDFEKYFSSDLSAIVRIVNLFRKARSEEMEAVSTLYACWEEILQCGHDATDELLIGKFYAWSKEKSKFSREKLEKTIGWMNENGIVPIRTST